MVRLWLDLQYMVTDEATITFLLTPWWKLSCPVKALATFIIATEPHSGWGVRLYLFTATSHGIMRTGWYTVDIPTGWGTFGRALKTEQNMTWTWNDAVNPQCRGIVSGMRLTWAWWRPRRGNPHSWGGCCPSWMCLSPWRPASWPGAGCTPGWSGPDECRVVRLARRSVAPMSQKTGDSGCSPSERGLRRGGGRGTRYKLICVSLLKVLGVISALQNTELFLVWPLLSFLGVLADIKRSKLPQEE